MKIEQRYLGGLGRAFAGAIAALALVGCATTDESTTPENAVRIRAKQRWDAVVKGDWERAYGYLTPSYRELVPFKTYVGTLGSAVQYLGAETGEVKCVDDRCDVVMQVSYRPLVLFRQTQPVTSQLQEVWLQQGGQWWMFQKQ